MNSCREPAELSRTVAAVPRQSAGSPSTVISCVPVAVAATGLFWLLSYFRHFSFAGDVPTQPLVLGMAVLLLVIFGISFFVEKTIDIFLGLISIGLVVFVVAAAAFLQGFLVGLHITDHHGLLNLLGG